MSSYGVFIIKLFYWWYYITHYTKRSGNLEMLVTSSMPLRPALSVHARHVAPAFMRAPLPTPSSAITWASWTAYMGVVLFSEGGMAPGTSALHTEPATIKEALDLSLNFWFVLPSILPSIAPVVDPSLEAMFNVLICWALCFWGFVSDEREFEYPSGMLPYLTGALFLTNVFYLPMLALRAPREGASLAEAQAVPLTSVQRLAENRAVIAVVGIVVPLLAVLWGCEARADEFMPGIGARWESLVALVMTDRLAFSFASDLLVFALFQGALVPADAARRNVDQSSASALAARFVPFFGLVSWLLTRPPLPRD